MEKMVNFSKQQHNGKRANGQVNFAEKMVFVAVRSVFFQRPQNQDEKASSPFCVFFFAKEESARYLSFPHKKSF